MAKSSSSVSVSRKVKSPGLRLRSRLPSLAGGKGAGTAVRYESEPAQAGYDNVPNRDIDQVRNFLKSETIRKKR